MSDKAPTVVTTAYVLNGISYLPHFRNKNLFVKPGYPRFNNSLFTKDELVNAGAKSADKFLWPRGEHGTVNAGNP
jgi:hypothetical protein